MLALWGDLREEEVKRVKRQQVVEVLEVKVKVVEHQGGVQSVSEMWEGKRGEVPAGAGNRVQYGLRVKATAVYPVPEEQQVPVGRTKQTLKDLLGCEMSLGERDECAEGLQRASETGNGAGQRGNPGAAVGDVDETGLRMMKASFSYAGKTPHKKMFCFLVQILRVQGSEENKKDETGQ